MTLPLPHSTSINGRHGRFEMLALLCMIILYRIPVVTGAISLLCYGPPLHAHSLSVRRRDLGSPSNVVNGTTALVRVNWNAVVALVCLSALTVPKKLLSNGRVTWQALLRFVCFGFPLQKLLVLSD